MSIEESIRQVIREENEKHLNDIKCLLADHGYNSTPRFLTVEEAAKILRCGITKTYEMCRQAETTNFPAKRVGGRYKISYTALTNWIDQQDQQAM